MRRWSSMALAVLCASASAADADDILTVSFPRGIPVFQAGETVTVPVALSNQESRQGVHLAIEFDTERITLDAVVAHDRLGPPIEVLQTVDAAGVVHVLAMDDTPERAALAPGDQTILSLRFVVGENVDGAVFFSRDNVAVAGALVADDALSEIDLGEIVYRGVRLQSLPVEGLVASEGPKGVVELQWGVGERKATEPDAVATHMKVCRAANGGRRVELGTIENPLTQAGFLDELPREVGEAGAVRYTLSAYSPETGVEVEVGSVALHLEGTTSSPVDGLPELNFAMSQNFPNPLSGRTTIGFQVPRREWVTITVYDVRGAVVRRLVQGVFEPGRHEVAWSGDDESGSHAASGIYFYRFESGAFTKTRKLVLLR